MAERKRFASGFKLTASGCKLIAAGRGHGGGNGQAAATARATATGRAASKPTVTVPQLAVRA